MRAQVTFYLTVLLSCGGGILSLFAGWQYAVLGVLTGLLVLSTIVFQKDKSEGRMPDWMNPN